MSSLCGLFQRKGRGIFAAVFSVLCLAASAAGFDESKTFRLQLFLDREGFSSNAADGQWGRRSQRAFEAWCRREGVKALSTPEQNFDAYFADRPELLKVVEVTAADLASLVTIPKDPAEKAKLAAMGYPNALEMFAERGHITAVALKRLNPGVDWQNVCAGLRIVVPDFPSIDEHLGGRQGRKASAKAPVAAQIRVSLSDFEIRVYDRASRMIALFPCSIAKDKAKRPPSGELKIVTQIANPNYTYTPDRPNRKGKFQRQVLPPGPRCPVGVAWLGLNLAGYGIHGTPYPETIGRAESHGCFRLSNWNVARLYSMVSAGTRVIVENSEN